ncbi:MAG: hypothetical protein AB8E82_16190 [Aureispira sp.]
MKYTFLIIAWFSTLIACQKAALQEEPKTAKPQEKIAFLQIDYLTNTFEGGTEWVFGNTHATFTIAPTYRSPGDFGNLALHYQEENALIFDGGIIWMGQGTMQTPATLRPASSFASTTTVLQQPSFEEIEYSDYPTNHPNTIPNTLWQSIQHLQLVADYRSSNPNGKVHFFLYTPSVGMGNPADWDWVVYLND